MEHVSLEVRLRAAATSDDLEELMNLGCAFAELSRLTEAEMCFRRAADLGSSDAAFNLGNVLAEQERWLDAARAFELAITRGDTEAWVSLGWVLHEMGDLAGEIRAYQQAETAGDSGGTLGLAFALREQGDREAAMGAAQRAAAAGNETAAGVVTCWQWDLTQDPLLEDALRAGAEHYPSARADLGHLLQSTGLVEAARQVWEQGIGRGEVESMLPLGNLYADVLDDEAAAEAAYLAATELGDAHAHNNLAILLEDRGDLEAAAMHYRLAIAGGDTLAVGHLRELLED
jgi:tetratricopeptide (TPR) repeat protein